MRVNPRTVILGALRERPLPLTGGNFTFSLAASVWLECFDGLERGWKRAYAGAMPTLQRHLCHLIRSRQVVRLPDGRYALRYATGREFLAFVADMHAKSPDGSIFTDDIDDIIADIEGRA